MSYTGISRYAGEAGVEVSPDVISRHASHRPPPERPKGTLKRDFATLVRERAAEQFESGELDLTERNHAAGIAAGLKAQAIIDKREVVNKKHTQADALVALMAALRGEGHRALPDPVAPPDAIDVTPIED